MKFQIDRKIFEQNPDLKIGAILIKGMDNSKRVSSVESLLRGVCAQREKEFKDKDVFEHPMVKAWCQAYGRFGVNPQKYPPSIAALLKRVKSGKQLTHINVLVDLYNYFSMKYLLPIGGEDIDWLCGDLNLTFTKGNEPFRPIGSIEVDMAKEGEGAYMDDAGITCRYWNYRECERTKFTNKTVNAVLFVEDLSKIHIDEFGSMLNEMQQTISKYIGGQIETYILNDESNTLELGVQGRKNMDDSKVPQQEKAHFIKEQQVKKKALPSSTSLSLKEKLSKQITTFEDNELFKFKVKALLNKALAKAFPDSQSHEVKVEYPAMADHGDYASNIALQLSKELNKNPREIAEKILAKIPANKLIEKSEIAGPGFINLFISRSAIELEIDKILLEKEKYGSLSVGKQKPVILEYSSPNIAKPLGAHHLLTTVIGQSIYNIFQRVGFKTISINHIGDWGTQFGKLIYAYKKWGTKEAVEKNPINEMLALYVKFHDEAEKDPTLEDGARKEFSDFEKGNKENKELWQWFVDESMKEINATYNLLGGIHFDYTQGESFYEDKLQDILDEGKEKGVFVEGEQGAYVVHFEDPNIPTVPVQKKDGSTLYITRDFATLKYRIKTFKPVKILYVVDVAQSLHFKQIFETAKMLGFYNGEGEHVVFGRMQMKDGNMSTRKGNIILLNEVIEKAIELADKVISEKNPELKNRKEVSRAVGIGSVKYNILSQNRITDIVFDWDKMLSFDGNSAPYLQYSYARAKSILRKADEKKDANLSETDEEGAQIEEKTNALIRHLPKFSESLLMSAAEYKPNILANYLYELAQKFNGFYNGVPVLKVRDEELRVKRLKIVEAVAQVLKNGLGLLGVEVVEEM